MTRSLWRNYTGLVEGTVKEMGLQAHPKTVSKQSLTRPYVTQFK